MVMGFGGIKRKKYIIDFFAQIFDSTGIDGKLSNMEVVKRLTTEEKEVLISPVTVEEVQDVVFSMHPGKLPGPDGLNTAFFSHFGV